MANIVFHPIVSKKTTLSINYFQKASIKTYNVSICHIKYITLHMKQEDISVKFSHVIKMLRKKESLKQVQLAEIMGIDSVSTPIKQE